jgi:hypothetical protein
MSISTYGWGVKSITTGGFGAIISSISVENFSMTIEEWLPRDDVTGFYVDVSDNGCDISTSGTYFMFDDVPIATTYSGIYNGYRFFCNTPTISGGLVVTMHAENECGEVKEQDYTILFGYRAEFTEDIDWGPAQDVTIWAKANNTVDCPNTESFATYFETKELEYKDLNAYILPTGSANLGAEIHPQTKAFLPGFTYTVTVSGVKDYSGNQMEPIVFTFTIEN